MAIAKNTYFFLTSRLTLNVRVIDPLVPVIVSVLLPSFAAGLVRIDNVDEPVAGFGLKEDVRSENPVTVRLTGLAKPADGVMVIVYETVLPAITVCVDGVAKIEKLGTAATIRVTVVVRVRLPLTPVIVSVYEPAAVAPPTVTFNVDADVVGFGANEGVTPAGAPLRLSVTLPLNPFVGVMATE
jgi:hypothetical protein